jgi:hypothetical protein
MHVINGKSIFIFNAVICYGNVNKIDMLNLNVRINTDLPFGEGSEI